MAGLVVPLATCQGWLCKNDCMVRLIASHGWLYGRVECTAGLAVQKGRLFGKGD